MAVRDYLVKKKIECGSFALQFRTRMETQMENSNRIEKTMRRVSGTLRRISQRTSYKKVGVEPAVLLLMNNMIFELEKEDRRIKLKLVHENEKPRRRTVGFGSDAIMIYNNVESYTDLILRVAKGIVVHDVQDRRPKHKQLRDFLAKSIAILTPIVPDWDDDYDYGVEQKLVACRESFRIQHVKMWRRLVKYVYWGDDREEPVNSLDYNIDTLIVNSDSVSESLVAVINSCNYIGIFTFTSEHIAFCCNYEMQPDDEDGWI